MGHLYEVKAGENVHDIMHHFGMTKKDIMFMNVDLSRQLEEAWTRSLPVGKVMCLVPNGCATLV